jgi:hypothetical protein
MSVAELEEKDIIEDESIMVEEVDEEVDNDQTVVDEIVSEDSSDEESSEVEDDEGIEISFDGESLTPEDEEDKDAPSWVKNVRKKNKETQKENRELKNRLAEIEASKVVETQVDTPKAKPTLEDLDYDSDAYEKAIDEWYVADRKRKEVEQAQQAEQKRAQDEWQAKLNDFEASKKKLGVKDYEDAEDFVNENLSQTQRGIIVDGSDNPALSFYALGKNQKLAKELASITNPVKFAFAVSKMENRLKTTKRKARTNPESTVKSSGGSGGKDNTLARLEAEADKSGDRSKVHSYRMKLRAKN